MGLTISDIRRNLYFKLRAGGRTDEDIFKQYPFLQESVEMGAIQAHFGTWKQMAITTVVFLVVTGIIIWWNS